MARAKVVHISPEDNVVVAIAPIAKGDEIKVDDIDLIAAAAELRPCGRRRKKPPGMPPASGKANAERRTPQDHGRGIHRLLR